MFILVLFGHTLLLRKASGKLNELLLISSKSVMGLYSKTFSFGMKITPEIWKSTYTVIESI